MRIDGQRMREALLQVCQNAASGDSGFQQGSALEEVRQLLGMERGWNTLPDQQALLGMWHDMYRQGLLSWGHSLGNPDLPFVHLTDRGRKALEQFSRDPYNRDGYLAAIRTQLSESTVAYSYLSEAVSTFNAGCLKATAVMVGTAAEALVLDLRDSVVSRMKELSKPVPASLTDWRAKTVKAALVSVLDPQKRAMGRELSELYEANWPMSEQIRLARNDAGHPADANPVSHELVHAVLLSFHGFAAMMRDLTAWVKAMN